MKDFFKNVWTNHKVVVIAFFVGLFIGVTLASCQHTPEKVVVKNVPGQTVVKTVTVPAPTTTFQKLDIPSMPIYIFNDIVKLDTVKQTYSVDTAAIVRNYIAVNTYSYNLFNNEHGKLDLRQDIQYNTIAHTEYTYTPIRQIEQHIVQRKWQIFLGGAYASNNSVGPAVGMLYKNTGIFANLLYNIPSRNSLITVSWMQRL